MAIHSSTLAWKIPWTKESGRLQFMGSQRVGHDFTSLHFNFFWKGPLVSVSSQGSMKENLITF